MLVKNLVSWAGHEFSYLPGEVVDLPDDVAIARVEGGVAVFVADPEPAADASSKKRG